MPGLVKYTVVFAWEAGQQPEIGCNDTFKKGKIVSCQFDDALEKMDKVDKFLDGLADCVDLLPLYLQEAFAELEI